MKAFHCKYTLDFKRPGGTSRGVLTSKETHLLVFQSSDNWGIGECGLFRGLSYDDRPEYEEKLDWVCRNVDKGQEYLIEALQDWPSIVFGLEQAFRSFESEDPMVLFPSPFLKGVPMAINGLVWMGDTSFMQAQINTLLASGFDCLKLKIGALDFDRELELLREIRRNFGPQQLEIRVDANGAFEAKEAIGKLEALAKLGLHSIEQPIKAGQWKAMAALCEQSPLPIALDEELIGLTEPRLQRMMLEEIRPQYIILKPSLVGGFKASETWIEGAEAVGAGWWVTSALESNIGLNAIAQWTASLGVTRHQGLGTGSLFENNFSSPLVVRQGKLWYDLQQGWELNNLKNICT